MRKSLERWHARHAETVGALFEELTEVAPELSESRRRLIAARLVARLYRDHGGRQYYWPKTDTLDRARRDAEIWAEYDGTPRSRRELAKRHDLSEERIRQILRAHRAMTMSIDDD